MNIEEALRTIIDGQDASRDRENYTAYRVDLLIRLVRREYRVPHTVRFAFFQTTTGDAFTMASITALDITTAQTLAFGLAGNTPQGDTFVEPTVEVTPTSAGTVSLQPSVQAAGGAFTTAGVFTPASGYTGPVELSADVQGVDDQDCTFNVVAAPAPETVAFDPTQFKAQDASAASSTGSTTAASSAPAPTAGA